MKHPLRGVATKGTNNQKEKSSSGKKNQPPIFKALIKNNIFICNNLLNPPMHKDKEVLVITERRIERP